MSSQLNRRRRVRVRFRRGAGAAGMVTAGAFAALVLASPANAEQQTSAAQSGVGSQAPASIGYEGPAGDAMFESDLFRTFTDCLAEAAHRDSIYPGIDPSEVNACLGL